MSRAPLRGNLILPAEGDAEEPTRSNREVFATLGYRNGNQNRAFFKGLAAAVPGKI
jgi:hypothetical protein